MSCFLYLKSRRARVVAFDGVIHYKDIEQPIRDWDKIFKNIEDALAFCDGMRKSILRRIATERMDAKEKKYWNTQLSVVEELEPLCY